MYILKWEKCCGKSRSVYSYKGYVTVVTFIVYIVQYNSLPLYLSHLSNLPSSVFVCMHLHFCWFLFFRQATLLNIGNFYIRYQQQYKWQYEISFSVEEESETVRKWMKGMGGNMGWHEWKIYLDGILGKHLGMPWPSLVGTSWEWRDPSVVVMVMMIE